MSAFSLAMSTGFMMNASTKLPIASFIGTPEVTIIGIPRHVSCFLSSRISSSPGFSPGVDFCDFQLIHKLLRAAASPAQNSILVHIYNY